MTMSKSQQGLETAAPATVTTRKRHETALRRSSQPGTEGATVDRSGLLMGASLRVTPGWRRGPEG